MAIDIEALDLDNGDDVENLMRRFYPLLLSTAVEDAGTAIGVDIAFDLDNPNVQRVLNDLATKVRRVAETTKDDIRRVVGRAADEGWDMGQLANELEQLAEITSASRAVMIARTESGAAYSKGALLGYQESGVVDSVEWLLSDDACPICQDIVAQNPIVPLGQAFADGVDHPPAHPDCRCALAPVLGE